MANYLDKKIKIICKNLDLSFDQMLNIITYSECEVFEVKGDLNLCRLSYQDETLVVSKTVKEQSVKYIIIKE